jgi:hypothetical protein
MLLPYGVRTYYLHAAAVTSGTLCAGFLFCSSPKPPDVTYWVHLVHFPVPSARCILLLALEQSISKAMFSSLNSLLNFTIKKILHHIKMSSHAWSIKCR